MYNHGPWVVDERIWTLACEMLGSTKGHIDDLIIIIINGELLLEELYASVSERVSISRTSLA